MTSYSFGPPGLDIVARSGVLVEQLLGYLGVPIGDHKTVGPTSSLTFLGIQLNTDQQQLSLLAGKLHRLQELIGLWQPKDVVTEKNWSHCWATFPM